jgi:hypothetical protein
MSRTFMTLLADFTGVMFPLQGCRPSTTPSTAEKIEDVYVASDQNTTLLAVFEDTCMEKVAVQGAQDFGLTNHGGMNDRVVVRI